MKLDRDQLQVVAHRGGPALVLAGPGSGKTATLIERVRALLEEGVNPGEITLVTFTQKAAREMARRLGEKGEGVFVGTLHALALRILLLKRRVRPLAAEEEEALFQEREGLETEVLQAWRRGERQRAALRAGLEEAALAERVEAHEQALLEEGLVPLPLLVREADRLLEEDETVQAWAAGRCRHLIVDEFQDTDSEQLLFLARIAPPPEADFMAVGDVDQSIYGWRGAEPEVVEAFRELYRPREYRLLTNYRAPERLVRLAARLSGQRLMAVRPGGEVATLAFANPYAEAAWIAKEAARLVREGLPPEEVAVLVRSGQQIPPLEEAFLRERLPYALAGGVALERRREIRLFLALLKGATLDGNSPEPDLALRLTDLLPGLGASFAARMVREWREGETLSALLLRMAQSLHPAKREKVVWLSGMVGALEALWEEAEADLPGVVEGSLEMVAEELQKAFARWKGPSPEERLRRLKRLPALAREWQASRPQGIPARLFPRAFFLGPGEEGGVRLSTVHAAKGLEWRAVFVPGLVEGIFPILGEGSLEEERRILYVALTRAKEKLYLSWFQRSLTGKPVERSRFLQVLFPEEKRAAAG
jgi:superfamily I DNA/RNA helicase